MIIGFEQLAAYRGQMAMVDGCFDPLHRGHLTYFAAARALGVPVLCNIAPDAYVAGKHPPFLPEEHRATLIDALRDIDLTHLNRGRTTADVLRELRPRYYVKGSDWRGRLPEQETSLCRELGIEITYVEVTPDASRKILGDFARRRSSELESQTTGFEDALQVGIGASETGMADASGPAAALLEALGAKLHPVSVYWLTHRIAATGPPTPLGPTTITVERFDPQGRGSNVAPTGLALDATHELAVGFWGNEPLPLACLTRIVRQVASAASRYACISAGFHPCAEHLLSLGGGDASAPGDTPRPARELVRVLFALEGFRSRRDVETSIERSTAQRVLVMERSS